MATIAERDEKLDGIVHHVEEGSPDKEHIGVNDDHVCHYAIVICIATLVDLASDARVS